MALARKAPSLLALNPDIEIVQECSKNSVDDLHSHGLSGLWFGSNPNKGVAVFCSKKLTLHWSCPATLESLFAAWNTGDKAARRGRAAIILGIQAGRWIFVVTRRTWAVLDIGG